MDNTVSDNTAPVTKEQVENLLEMCFTQDKYDTACKILLDLIVQLRNEIESLKGTVRRNKIETMRF